MAFGLHSKKKPASKGKSKAVVSTSKHRSFRLTAKTFAFGVVAAGVLATVGTLGYNKIKHGSFTAQAASYTNFPLEGNINSQGGYLHACKTKVESGDYLVKVYAKKPTSSTYAKYKYVTIDAGNAMHNRVLARSYPLNSTGWGWSSVYTRATGWHVHVYMSERSFTFNDLANPPVKEPVGGPGWTINPVGGYVAISVASIANC